MSSTAWGRLLGWLVIAALWSLVLYLSIYYSLLLIVGAGRLHQFLGERVYNAVVPAGGFTLLLIAGFYSLAWVLPFLVVALSFATLLRVACPKWSHRSRRALVTVVAVLACMALPHLLLDGWPGSLWPLLESDDTHFADGYSAWGFWRVGEGMLAVNVLKLVGEPLERQPDGPAWSGDEIWRWTESPSGGNYRLRLVVLRSGRVVRKASEFYLD